MKGSIKEKIKNMSREEVLEKLEMGEVGVRGEGMVDGDEMIRKEDSCFGRRYLPDATCASDCTAKAKFDGEEIMIRDACKVFCSGPRKTSDVAAKFFRPDSGSYYIVKALAILGRATKLEIMEKAVQLAEIDGNGDKLGDVKDRTTRTLSSLVNDRETRDRIEKRGHGDKSVYNLK